MILPKLKEATRQQHAQLELTVDVAQQTQEVKSYERLLRTFYGFYAPLEPQLLRIVQAQKMAFDYESRLKTP